MRRSRLMVLVLPALMLGACADAEPMAPTTEGADAAGARGGQAAANRTPTVVEVALAVNAETGEFSTLIAAVLAGQLAGELSANGQRTVFAPTDAAFAELGLNAGNISTLPVGALRNILLYHVSPGRRDAASVVTADRLRMASGGFTRITLREDGAYINESRIVLTDIAAANGIIHVIDRVLLP
jgi:uncharacterized surface protein with fasciclin (FAS1) repeats